MIAVSPELVRQVEYLISQSRQGHHVLFEPGTIKKIMKKFSGKPIPDNAAYEAEPHLERILELPTLARKRAYMEKLDKQTYELVVRTYFNIIENHLFECSDVNRH
jgi:hypothetical protein